MHTARSRRKGETPRKIWRTDTDLCVMISATWSHKGCDNPVRSNSYTVYSKIWNVIKQMGGMKHVVLSVCRNVIVAGMSSA